MELKVYEYEYIYKFILDFSAFCVENSYIIETYTWSDHAIDIFMRKKSKDDTTQWLTIQGRVEISRPTISADISHVVITERVSDIIISEYYIHDALKHPRRHHILANGTMYQWFLLPMQYIILLFRAALSCMDEKTLDGMLLRYNDYILEDDNKEALMEEVVNAVKYYTTEKKDGAITAWLLEFKKNYFGHEVSEEGFLL